MSPSEMFANVRAGDAGDDCLIPRTEGKFPSRVVKARAKRTRRAVLPHVFLNGVLARGEA